MRIGNNEKLQKHFLTVVRYAQRQCWTYRCCDEVLLHVASMSENFPVIAFSTSVLGISELVQVALTQSTINRVCQHLIQQNLFWAT